jgi:hypothetical protein
MTCMHECAVIRSWWSVNTGRYVIGFSDDHEASRLAIPLITQHPQVELVAVSILDR